MTTLARSRWWRRRRRDDILLGVLVTNLVVGVVIAAAAITIAHEFEPEGSLFGRPMRIPACGQTYSTRPDVTTVFTRAQIEAVAAAGSSPVVLEPAIGQIPLFAPFAEQQHAGGAQRCDTLIYLHVGDDAYAAYGLEGSG